MAKKVTELNSDYVYPRSELKEHSRIRLMQYAENRWNLPRNKAKAITSGIDIKDYEERYGDFYTGNCQDPEAMIEVIIWPSYQRDGHAGARSLKKGAPVDPEMAGSDEESEEAADSNSHTPEEKKSKPESKVVVVDLEQDQSKDEKVVEAPAPKKSAIHANGTLDNSEFGSIVAQLVKIQSMMTDIDGRLAGMSTRSIDFSSQLAAKVQSLEQLADEQSSLLHHVVDNILPGAFSVLIKAVCELSGLIENGGSFDASGLYAEMDEVLLPSGIGKGEKASPPKGVAEESDVLDVPVEDLLDEDKYDMAFIIRVGAEHFGLDLRGLDRVEAVNAIQIQVEG